MRPAGRTVPGSRRIVCCLHLLNLQLTFASLNAPKPSVIEVTRISTFVKTSATASATTALAGFLDGTTPGTCRPTRLYDGHQIV